jgi:hypothetical protein
MIRIFLLNFDWLPAHYISFILSFAMVLSVLGVLIGFCCVALSSQQDCVLWPITSNQPFLAYDEVQACLKSIEFVPEVQSTTMASVIAGMESYIFKDIVYDSPNSQLLHIEVGKILRNNSFLTLIRFGCRIQ